MKEDIKEYWDKTYAYAELDRIPSDFVSEAVRAIDELSVPRLSILVVGAGLKIGDIYAILEAVRMYNCEKIVITDASEVAVIRLRSALSDRLLIGNSPVSCEVLDITEGMAIPEECNKYDLVYCRWVLHAIPDSCLRMALINLSNLVANGGRLLAEFRSDREKHKEGVYIYSTGFGQVYVDEGKHLRHYLDGEKVLSELTKLGLTQGAFRQSSDLFSTKYINAYTTEFPVLERISVNKPKSKITWDILIRTMPSRSAQLNKLLGYLHKQILDNPYRHSVEVIVTRYGEDEKEGEVTTAGEKAQILLDLCDSDYLCFIDDDDMVSPDYIEEISRLLLRRPLGVGFRLRYRHYLDRAKTVLAEESEAIHSNRYLIWATTQGEKGILYERTLNHLNPVKTELAKEIGFEPINHGEDHYYSMRLREAIANRSNEHCVESNKVLYYYDFVENKHG